MGGDQTVNIPLDTNGCDAEAGTGVGEKIEAGTPGVIQNSGRHWLRGKILVGWETKSKQAQDMFKQAQGEREKQLDSQSVPEVQRPRGKRENWSKHGVIWFAECSKRSRQCAFENLH